MPDGNEIYQFLKSNNLTDKDEKSFTQEYSDPKKAEELHSFFVQNKLTDKDSATFYDTYLKKKGQEPSTTPVATSQSQLPLVDTKQLLSTAIQKGNEMGANMPAATQLPIKPQFDVSRNIYSEEQDRKAADISSMNDKAKQAHVERQAEMVKNTVDRKFRNEGKEVDPNTVEYRTNLALTNKKVEDGDLVEAKDKFGNLALTRPATYKQGYGIGHVIAESFKAPVNAWDVNKETANTLVTGDNSKLIALLDERNEETPEIEDYKPSKLAEFAGGAVKPVALNALNLVPGLQGVGTAAAVTEAGWTSYANSLQSLYQKGLSEGLSKEEAVDKAKTVALAHASADAAVMAVLSKASPASAAASTTAANTLKQGIISTIKSSPKMMAAMGGAEGGKAAVEKAFGYDVKASDILDKTIEGATEGALMHFSFAVGEGIAKGTFKAPKYIKNLAFDYLSKVPKEVVNSNLEGNPNADVIKEQLANYEAEKSKVEGVVPDEHTAYFTEKEADKTELNNKINELKLKKQGKSEALVGDINDQIKAHEEEIANIDKGMVKAKETGNIIHVDDETGDTHDLSNPLKSTTVIMPKSVDEVGGAEVKPVEELSVPSEAKVVGSGGGEDVEMTYEEKKADIEKRRQEELGKFSSNKNWGKREEINQEYNAELDKLKDTTAEGIEEKRQDHLKKYKQDHPDNWGQTTDNGDGTETVNFTGKKFNNEMSAEAQFVDMGGYEPDVTNPYDMIISTDKPQINKDGVLDKAAVVKVGKFRDKVAADEWLKNEKEKRIEIQPKREAKINAKYDDELQSLPTQEIKQTKSEVVSDVTKPIQDEIKAETQKPIDQTDARVPTGDELIAAKEKGTIATEVDKTKPTASEGTGGKEPPKPPIEEPKDEGEDGSNAVTSGGSHNSLVKLAERLGLPIPERGEVFTNEEYTQRGQVLLKNGADPIKIAEDFEKTGLVNAETVSVAKAHLAELEKIADNAKSDFGIRSEQFKKAKKDVYDWSSNTMKPMGTKWAEIGRTLQGETDLDTGSYINLARAVEEKTGKPLTTEQHEIVEKLSTRVKLLDNQVKELAKKLSDVVDKAIQEEKNKPVINKKAEAAKRTADAMKAFRRASGLSSGGLESLPEFIEVIKAFINEGLVNAKDIIDRIRQEFPKLNISDEAIVAKVKEAKTIDIRERFADKKGNNFSLDEVKAIWDYAKSDYLDSGADYREMLKGVSVDLGLTTEQVRSAISQPKSARVITDEMYRIQKNRNDAINQSKQYVETVNNSKAKSFFKAIPNFFFALKTAGHGTVGAITHAGMNLFQPSTWKIYFPYFIKQFQHAFGGLTKNGLAKYEKAMEDLELHPKFTFWQRAGLAVEPKKSYGEYDGLAKYFGKLSEIGNRGFNALKPYRLELAEHFYNKLSNSEKADPNSAKEIAKLVNHSTGTTEVNVPKWTSTAFFAPKLEISRWQGLVTDPAKAVSTFTSWNKSTLAEKAMAKRVAKNAGEKMATYMALLAANSAILSLAGSKNSINYTDPTKSDWLKFKIGDKTIDFTGGVESTMRFIGDLLHEGYLAYTGDKKTLREKPQDKDYKTIGQQLRYKLSPFMSTVVDVVTGTDAMGRPLPYSKVKPKKGEERYSVGSYLLHQQTPIPISEGVKETVNSMKQNGMSNAQVKDILMGILVGTISGGTGVKVGDVPKKK